MMTPGCLVRQSDFESDQPPRGNDERLWVRCAGATLIGLTVGLAYLVEAPALPGLVRAVWCLGPATTACDPHSQLSGMLIDLVVWAMVSVTTATAVTVLLGSLVSTVGRVRVTLPLVVFGPPALWSIAVLGQPVGIPLAALRTPAVLAQAVGTYLLVGALGSPKVRPHWRWLITVLLLVATAAVIASGYAFD
jgi:hypothetical protein